MSDEESSNQDELSDRQANNKRKPNMDHQFNYQNQNANKSQFSMVASGEYTASGEDIQILD